MNPIPPDNYTSAKTNSVDFTEVLSARSNQRYHDMLSEDDLREFYEEQLKEQQEKLRRATEEKAKLFEEQIDLLQKLIRNQNKLWGIE